MLNLLRNFKHSLFIGWKKRNLVIDETLTFMGAFHEYHYDSGKYRKRYGDIVVPRVSTFNINHLDFSAKTTSWGEESKAPLKIFLCWTGENKMSRSRQESLDYIKADNPGFEVILVTSDNYTDFVVPGHPLHPAYKKLSYVHRSDYLRAYLMYHYGGVYTDVKMLNKPWDDIVSRLNQSDAWAAGPVETSSANVSPAWGILGKHQRLYWKQVLWPAAFVFKPKSPLAQEWLEEVERRLDYFSSLLEKNESSDPIWGLDSAYPIPWNAILGQILSPLCLKYSDKLIIDKDMKFVVNEGGYR